MVFHRVCSAQVRSQSVNVRCPFRARNGGREAPTPTTKPNFEGLARTPRAYKLFLSVRTLRDVNVFCPYLAELSSLGVLICLSVPCGFPQVEEPSGYRQVYIVCFCGAYRMVAFLSIPC